MKIVDDTNSRYHRQELITWWDQSKLGQSKVLVVGAGALGNEVVKNLALVGVGHIDIVDMDVIEHSNLARCVFFRDEDENDFKAEVLAKRASGMNPGITTHFHKVPVQRLGIGKLKEFDVIIGALDNREARAWVNQACRKLGLFWIDGAIEGLRGLARMFDSTGPCYECTLTEHDYKQMSHRKSCALLRPEEIISGKTPTNATTASVIAGVQVQEVIKLLVGRRDMLSLVGKCWVFTGDSMDTYVTKYAEDDFCIAHDSYPVLTEQYDAVSPLDIASTFDDLSSIAIDFEDELITLQPCPDCGGETLTKARSSLQLGAGQCSKCKKELPAEMSTSLIGDDARLQLSFNELGLAARDIITVRVGEDRHHYLINGMQNGG